jgi:cbb3-type cytochrome oxidase subunit 3
MIDWLSDNGGMLVLVLFFTMFLVFAGWALAPGNKKKMEDYGHIPLKETGDGE